MIEDIDEFRKLLTSRSKEDRDRARNEPLADHLWSTIFDHHAELWDAIALHKKAPQTILHQLATVEDERIRALVAMRRKLMNETFLRLAEDPCEGVRARIARNPKTPDAILKRLTLDVELVASVARQRLGGNRA